MYTKYYINKIKLTHTKYYIKKFNYYNNLLLNFGRLWVT